MKVSIIIPYKLFNEQTAKCFKHCLEQSFQDFEIIALPDQRTTEPENNKIKVIETDSVKPSVKRNIGIKKAQGEILAFIDSDAYAVKDWLKIALPYFKKEEVGGVGGPNLTPSDSSTGQKVSGYIFASAVATGAFALRYQMRYKFRQGLPVKEMPSCNLIVRKEAALKINGFDETLLTGEDAKFCFNIRKKLDKRILYVPQAVVYHQRRHLWKPHLKQVWNYGRDKAWVIKEDFSLDKFYYFIPFSFVLFLFFGAIISLFSSLAAKIFLFLISIYLLIILATSLMANFKLSPLIFIGIILTHLSYGLGFFYGLVKKRR